MYHSCIRVVCVDNTIMLLHDGQLYNNIALSSLVATHNKGIRRVHIMVQTYISILFNTNNNNNGRNGSFSGGWLPDRGKALMACNYCFPTRTMF